MRVGATGGGIGVAVLALVGYLVFGLDPDTTLQIADQLGNSGGAPPGVVGTPADLAGQFVDVIGANINDVWDARITDYSPPKIVLYEQGTPTGCGYGQSAVGPFYCPADTTIYLDLGFWQEMETKLGASGAEFARAYVIAHEFGHHVQMLTGESDAASAARRSGSADANRLSVALELQADCYAGVWAANASAASGGEVAPEGGDLERGLQTANAIGEDALQSHAGGRVSPEQFTHGSSAQRVEWLRRGYQTGDPTQCATRSGH